MIAVNFIALYSFLIPFYMISSIQDESEMFFSKSNIGITLENEWECFIFERLHDITAVLNIIWLVGVVLFLVINIYEYISLIQKIKKKSFHIKEDTWTAISEKIIKEYKCNKKIHIVGNPEIFEPCVIGIKEYYIIILAKLIGRLTIDEIEFILRHEFFHIKHNDVLVRFFMIILTSFHWFNPMFYFLRQNLYECIEINCDEAVTCYFDEEKRISYCELIIKIAEESKQYKLWKSYVVCIGGNAKKNHLRRMDCIMKGKKKGSIVRNAIILTVACSWLCVSTAIAKEMDFKVNQMFSNRVVVFNQEEDMDETYVTKIDQDESADLKENSYAKSISDNQLIVENDTDTTYELIFEDGTSIPYYGTVEYETKHLHDLKDTIIKQHKKLKDGSCETKYYEGRYCTKCDLVFYDELIRTVIETSCPH